VFNIHDGAVYGGCLAHSNGSNNYNDRGVRPVVTLNSKIWVSSGENNDKDGTAEAQWELK
jgi:hypothetical protein